MKNLTFNEGFWCNELNKSFMPGFYKPVNEKEFEVLYPYSEEYKKERERPELKPSQVNMNSKRAELMARLEELKIPFKKNLSNEKLLELVEEAEEDNKTENS